MEAFIKPDLISIILGGISGVLVAVAVRRTVSRLLNKKEDEHSDESESHEQIDPEESQSEDEPVDQSEIPVISPVPVPTEPGTSSTPI